MNLWGLDAIKTKGESVGIVLELVGARSVKEGTGRVVRYELIPLDEMNGRPRVDVLCSPPVADRQLEAPTGARPRLGR